MVTLDYWMLNTIHDALEKQYADTRKSLGYDTGLAYLIRNNGLKEAKEAERELQDNRWHPLGKIWQSMKRIEKMREEITEHFTNTTL